MNPRASLVTVAACLLLSGGCASTPATHYYVLSGTAAAPVRSNPAPIAVVISDVALPQYLDRSQIVIRGRGHRVLVIENALWAGNLHEDMTRVLTENLAGLLSSERVVAAPQQQRIEPDYRVAVQVLRFERGSAGRVELSARWWLTRVSDGALLASPIETFSGAQLADGAGYEAVVASMSAVYGELAQVMARRINEAGSAAGKADK